jgi:hypothetical protein
VAGIPLITSVRPHLRTASPGRAAWWAAVGVFACLASAKPAAGQVVGPMVVRAYVTPGGQSQRAIAAGRALLAQSGRGAPRRLEVGVATVQIVPDKRPVLSVQYLRN